VSKYGNTITSIKCAAKAAAQISIARRGDFLVSPKTKPRMKEHASKNKRTCGDGSGMVLSP
jgi:hypothetical protein